MGRWYIEPRPNDSKKFLVTASFNAQFDQHGAWRRAFAQQLKQLGQWMASHDLVDDAVAERLKRLEELVRSDKVTVTFVAEFSRGKSELINAIFFADYGRRIMPASAGRTTMCPTELGYDADVPPSLFLLPIETRLQSQGLAEWRLRRQGWQQLPLDMDDAAQLAQAFEKVAELRTVTVDEARALGFWHDEALDDNPPRDAQGLVSIPMWRHDIINIPHPLLKQGLVILDTPGLNAVGAEPELTINLISQAHAVVFLLGADTGVTRSDLAIWRDHLGISQDMADSRLIVLNKIDNLWDTINSPAQVQQQLERQRHSVAQTLGMPLEQVLTVSAQKGLLAKIKGDAALLQDSGLPQLEHALVQGIVGKRQNILTQAVVTGVLELHADARRVINIRRRDLDEQMLELRSLRGKNASVVQSMLGRITQEQREFDSSSAKIQAVRSVHLRMLRQLYEQLSAAALKAQLQGLDAALQAKGLKLGLRKIYAHTFEQLRQMLDKAQASAEEIFNMLGGTFRQLNAEFGFSLQVPSAPKLQAFEQELSDIEQRHLQYIGMGNALRLAQPEFTHRLARALGLRLRSVFDAAANELEGWSKAATAQLDAQLRERKRSFVRRIEAVNRIQQAASGLMERIAEIEDAEKHLEELQRRLEMLAADLGQPPQMVTVEHNAFVDTDTMQLSTQTG